MAARRDVGVLFQNPENQLVAERVEDDIAFGLENLGWPPPRHPAAGGRDAGSGLSLRICGGASPICSPAGQKQRTALAGVLAVPRRALVLDEPTAMLDPAGRAEVLARGRRPCAARVCRRVHHAGDGRGGGRRPGRGARSAARRCTRATWPACSPMASSCAGLGLGLPAAGEVALALTARGRAPRPRYR